MNHSPERAVLSKVTWRLIPLLFFCYIIAYIDRINVGFAKSHLLEVLGGDEKVFDGVYGFGAGLFFIGYFIFEVPSNLILHRVGARMWIARIMIIWGFVSMAMMFIHSKTVFYVMRFLLGAAEAGFFPGVILYLTYWYPAKERARTVALFTIGGVVAGVIGSPISGTILGGSPVVSASQIINPASLAAQLRVPSNSVSQFLWNQFSPAARQALSDTNAAAPQLRAALLPELKKIVAGPSFYEANRFTGIALSPMTLALVSQAPHGERLMRLNRGLLEDAYPQQFTPFAQSFRGMDEVGGLAGWKWLFLLEAIPAVLMGIVVWFVLPDRPQQARWLTKEEKAIIQARLDSDAAAMGQHQNHRLMDAFTSGRVWLLCLLYFLMNVGGYGYELWMPSIIKSFSGKSDLMVGLINAIPYTFAGVVMFLVGRHSDRMGERRWHVAGAAFASAIGFALSAYFQNQYLALAALALAFAGIKSTLGPFWALATGFLSGTAAAGGIALINSVGNLGGYFGPDIVGRIKVYIHDPAAGNVVALLFLGAALFGMGVMTLTIRTKSKPAGLARDS